MKKGVWSASIIFDALLKEYEEHYVSDATATLGGMFIFMFIPSLTQHLKQRYGEQYETWEKSTKAFIPFVY